MRANDGLNMISKLSCLIKNKYEIDFGQTITHQLNDKLKAYIDTASKGTSVCLGVSGRKKIVINVFFFGYFRWKI